MNLLEYLVYEPGESFLWRDVYQYMNGRFEGLGSLKRRVTAK